MFSLSAIWILLILIVMAGLMMSGALRPDLAALILVLGLSFSGLLSPQEAFSGFSRSAVIALIALFILTAGLNRTGVSRILGERLSRWAGNSPQRLVAGMTLLTALLSMAMNSVTAAAVTMPLAVQAARRIGLAPSRILIPIAYGALLGGMPTLFTTANLLLSGLLRESQGRSLTMLDFLVVGWLPALLGLLWVILVTWRTLPERFPAGQLMRLHRLNRELAEIYGLKNGLVELLIEPTSPLAGVSLGESELASRYQLMVVGIRRGGRLILSPARSETFQPGDVLLIAAGSPGEASLEEATRALKLRKLPRPAAPEILEAGEAGLIEILLSPHTTLIGKTLRELRFRERYGLQVLAIWREGRPIRAGLADERLRFGDALLAYGPWERIRLLQDDPEFIVLQTDGEPLRPSRRIPAIGIMLGVILASIMTSRSVAELTMAGAVLMILTGCLTMEEAYRAIEWPTVFMVAGLLPLSIAISRTGAAQGLGELLLQGIGGTPPWMGILAFTGIAAALTQVLSASVTAVVWGPIALRAAPVLGIPPHWMGLAVALATSAAFLTPMAHPANALVMGAGGYRPKDFLKAGLPLWVLSIGAITLSTVWFGRWLP
ncbi:SLC13 family permease [Thermoflexus sp.]|uniref:SLC13 family permease n=1 Tax=Thermoflexus sp. TaxID=1969742 RepID=UPI00175C7FBE|nr:SLC13 family permease [Thermoflexus sp.]